jgi:hypothetical protein
MEEFSAVELAEKVYSSKLLVLDTFECLTKPDHITNAVHAVDDFIELSGWKLTRSQRLQTIKALTKILDDNYALDGSY